MSVEYSGAQVPSSVEADSLYEATLNYMQQGRWQDAAKALATLQQRYPKAGELETIRQTLALHLSAEQSWSGTGRRRLFGSLRLSPIRLLALANVLLYLIVAAMWVVGRMGGRVH